MTAREISDALEDVRRTAYALGFERGYAQALTDEASARSAEDAPGGPVLSTGPEGLPTDGALPHMPAGAVSLSSPAASAGRALKEAS